MTPRAAPAPAQDPFPKLPHELGRYKLLERIDRDRGGMGAVYKAHHPVLDRTVAVKVPKSGGRCSDEEREQFLRESRLFLGPLLTLTRGEGARVCSIDYADVIDGCPFFAMEYLDGLPLDEYWKAERNRLGPEGAGALVERVARLMAEVHRREIDGNHIVHLDLKPSNIIACQRKGQSEPDLVLFDFGLALAIDPTAPPRRGSVAGTVEYMPPEQLVPGWRGRALSPRSDVYSLGAVLYQLLTGRPPHSGEYDEAVLEVLNEDPPWPGTVHPAFRRYDAVCKRALARDPDDRYQKMDEFADALAVVYLDTQLADSGSPGSGGIMTAPPPVAIPARFVRYAFVPHGYTVPAGSGARDRLFLDVGNRLGPGVIDHHHLPKAGPTAKLVCDCGELIDAAVPPTRNPDSPFTIVLHNYPDLDAVTAAYFAVEYLANRAFPDRRDALVRYVERADQGQTRLDPNRPYSLHVAFTRLAARTATLGGQHERNRAIVRDGLKLIEFVLREATRTGTPVEEFDAFAAPVFGPTDRAAVLADRDRYRAKLTSQKTGARRCRLRLAGRDGFEKRVEGLIVRDVQNVGDPARVAHFKDWARGDQSASRDRNGFAALCVFMAEEPGHPRRCILSVTPECGASLKGLGALLDEAETKRRIAAFDVDNRREDPATGAKFPARTGYDNADPWYDGRGGHDFTIVDAPFSGTRLAADEIERIFLSFGNATEIEPVTA